MMTDSFTKFAQAMPCRDQTAPVVAAALRDHWFGCYGIPTQLHSDQGRNFEGELIRELCAMYGVRKSRTTSYHPQGNGQTERFNHTLCSLIRSLAVTERRRWPEALPHLLMVYNATPHRVTDLSPYELMFGRQPVLPVDQLINNTRQDWDQEYIQEQAAFIQRAQAAAKRVFCGPLRQSDSVGVTVFTPPPFRSGAGFSSNDVGSRAGTNLRTTMAS